MSINKGFITKYISTFIQEDESGLCKGIELTMALFVFLMASEQLHNLIYMKCLHIILKKLFVSLINPRREKNTTDSLKITPCF